jgi:hypothetical protein
MRILTKSNPLVRRSTGAVLLVGVLAGVLVGGLAVVRATSGSSLASSFVPMTPVRVVDTRSDLGLVSLVDGVEQSVTIVGSLVPLGATAVSLTVTAVDAGAAGFVSVRPGDATGVPSTSNLNVERSGTIANSVVVKLPTVGDHTGTIKVLFDAMGTTTASTDVLIDVLGYYELASTGPAGETGAKGDTGETGAKGDTGETGAKGDTGETGAKGDTGETGAKGDTGSAGAKGDTGAPGTNGTNGVNATLAITQQSVCDGSDADSIANEICKVGMTGPGGGIIFFVDYDDQYTSLDYLEAAPMGWGNAITVNVGGVSGETTGSATVDPRMKWCSQNTYLGLGEWANYAVGAGRSNTSTADTTCTGGAIQAAADYAGGGKTDWFLPSLGEAMLMYTNLRQLGVGVVFNESGPQYWSSTEVSDGYQFDRASTLDFREADLEYWSKSSQGQNVRPVRAF